MKIHKNENGQAGALVLLMMFILAAIAVFIIDVNQSDDKPTAPICVEVTHAVYDCTGTTMLK